MPQGILVSFGQSCIQLQWHGIVCDHFELKVIPLLVAAFSLFSSGFNLYCYLKAARSIISQRSDK